VEARDFRGRYSEFTALGAEVVGVSSDSEGRHASFARSLNLPFPLVSDQGSRVARAFGLTRAAGWLPSKRVTFVIDRKGMVRRVISAELDIARHAREALAALAAID
jgi:peroxiredoxin Q/BCP